MEKYSIVYKGNKAFSPFDNLNIDNFNSIVNFTKNKRNKNYPIAIENKNKELVVLYKGTKKQLRNYLTNVFKLRNEAIGGYILK